MINNLLSIVVVGGLVGTVVLAPAPEPRPVASRLMLPASVDVAAASPTALPATSAASAVSYILPSEHPPVPLMRTQRVSTATPPSVEVKAYDTEGPAQEALNKTAAKVAIEADGYKGVTVVGKAADGTWRAKAYRGNTEVLLTVDGMGRVSTE